MIIPTKRLWALVALGIPLALAGLVVPGLEQLVLPYNLLLAALWWITGKVALRQHPFMVSRFTDPVLSVRAKNQVRVLVENASNTPHRIRVRDEVPANCLAEGNEQVLKLPGYKTSEFTYTAIPQSRGRWDFRGTYIRYAAPLGLAEVQVAIGNEETARVFPNVKAVQEFELLKQSGHLSLLGMRQSRVKGLGMEFESLREYNDDDYRTIDWKASARRGKLVVRNFEQETNQAVMICVDTGRHMLSEIDGVRKLDLCLDAALLLMHAAERANDQTGLLLFNDEVQRYIAPKRGKAQIGAILDAVFDIQAEPVQSNYLGAFSYLASRWKRRSLVIIFTDAENEDQAKELSAALGLVRSRHLIYVVRVSDPKWKLSLVEPVNSERILFDQAAALWYRSDRQKAEATLRTLGYQNIEAEPQDLATALVQAYLRVKQLSLI